MARLVVLLLLLVPFSGALVASGEVPSIDGVECHDAAAPFALADGVATSASFPQQVECYFTFAPAAGSTFTRVRLDAMDADVDLRVRRGADPSFTEFDCRSWASGTTPEVCEVDNDGQVVHIMVFAIQSGGNFTITASALSIQYCDLVYANIPVALGTTHLQTVSEDAGAMCFYELVGDGLTETIVVKVAPVAVNLDVFLREGRRPTLQVWDCRSESHGTNEEACTAPNVAGKKYYVLVHKPAGGSTDFDLSVYGAQNCSLGLGDTPLALGSSVNGTLPPLDYVGCYFTIVGDGTSDAIDVALDMATGDFDLFVSEGERPSYLEYDCSSANGGTTTERCRLENTPGRTYYALALRFGGDGEFAIRADAFDFPELEHGVPVSAIIGMGEEHYYKLRAPEGIDVLAVTLTTTDLRGDADLYVRHLRWASADAFDCRSAGETSFEACVYAAAALPSSVPNVQPMPGTGIYFVAVRGVAPISHYEITVRAT